MLKAHHALGIFRFVCLLLGSQLWLSFSLFAQESPALLELLEAELPSNRVTVAMVPLENATGDPALDHWRFAATSVLGPQLGEAKGLRLLPQSSLKYGLAQLHKKPGDPVDAGDAERLGELIEARRVLWGSYRHDRGEWQVSARILNVSERTPSAELTASSADWFDLRDKLTKKILKELGVTPTGGERRKMKAHWTKSASALESLARARAASDHQEPAAEWEAYVRQALRADPHCAEAWAALAFGTGTQGKMEVAMTAARQAIELNPDLAMGHSALGQVLIAAQRSREAEAPLEKAVLLDPDNPTPVGRLAECCLIEKEMSDAVAYFRRSLQLSPFQASLHANLGRAYLFQGKRERGLAELKEAERLTFEPDLNTEEYLAWGYERLNDAPAAIKHYEAALTIARRISLNPERVEILKHGMDQLKASMAPVFVNVPPPKEYTEESLTQALPEKLTREECALVPKPLAGTPEISLRAAELTHGVTNDLQKARLLFEALAGNLNVGQGELRTAAQSFAAWKGEATAFTCQEYTLLYSVMARAVGIRSYYADVRQACDGEPVSHACAAVFDGDRALLVDPSYRWFGAPHKKFRVLNDLEATAEYLSQLGDLRLRRIATKLDPKSAYAHFKLASKCFVEEKWEEAREELPQVARLDADGGMADCLKAMLALHDKHFDATVEFGRKALEHGWPANDGFVYVIMGGAYYRQGRLSEARDAFRTVLRCSPDDKSAEAARRAIARIDELIGSD